MGLQEHTGFDVNEIARAHYVPLRPNGISLTEEHHADRQSNQALLVERRIQELMASDDPLSVLMQSKLAHRGLGFDRYFDEAIEELRNVFGYNDVQIKSASAEAFRREAARRAKIKEAAQAAGRRAGLIMPEDENSLAPPLPPPPAPRVRKVAPTPETATFTDLKEPGKIQDSPAGE